MRSNGLSAPKFDVLADVDQRVSAHVLRLMADVGIAAYARQRANSAGYVGRLVIDRIWVDAERRDEADTLLADNLSSLIAEFDTEDDDAAFEAIVAGWDGTPAEPVGRWPVQEEANDPKGDGSDGDVDDDDRRDVPASGRRRLIRPARTDVPEVVEDDFDDDAHFVPEPPPPLPKLPRNTAIAMWALLGGVAVLLISWLLDLTGGYLQWLGLAGVLGGATALIVRMRDKLPPEEGGPDDGAVL